MCVYLKSLSDSSGSVWVSLVSQVSIAICNLHAMAEGARLTLLYVDNQQNHDMVGILVPILSGVLWNVLTRIGCLDRCLHCVSRGRWKPNNCSKLLRESGAA